MRKRTPVPPEKLPQRSGPPPLRKVEPRRAPKPKARANLREVIRALSHPTVGTLRRDLSHYLVYGLIGFVVIFAAGAFFSFGDAAMRGAKEAESGAKLWPVMASVGRAKLERDKFEDQLRQVGMMRNEMVTMRFQQIGQMFDRWVDQQLIARAAARRGVGVSGADLDKELDKRVEEALKGERGSLSDRDWRYKLQQQGKDPDAIKSDLRAKLRQNEDQLQAFLLETKLRENVEKEVKITEEDLHNKYDEIAGNVIVLNVDSPKPPPAPEGTNEGPEATKRRSDQQNAWDKAMAAKQAEAQKVLAAVQAAPQNFEALAKQYSKDYTAAQGGQFKSGNRDSYELARFGDEFKKTAFQVPVGQISGLIKGDPGWVIVKVTAKKTWPTDFSKPDPRDFNQAKAIADQVYDQLVKGADFAALAKAKSEDPGSKDKGGEYDLTGRGVWVKPFEKMAFALAPNEISKPFRTQFGWHVMQVLQREPLGKGEKVPPEADDPNKTPDEKAKDEAELKALPLPNHADLAAAKRVKIRHILIKAEDPQKKLDDLRKQLETEKKSKYWQDFLKKERDAAYGSKLIEVQDPELQAYLAQKNNKPEEQLFWLRRAAAAWPDLHPEVHYELGKLYAEQSPMAAPPTLKVAAAKSLAKMGQDPNVVPALIKALDTFEPDTRKAIIGTLGDLKAQAAATKLQEIVRTDPDDSVALAATDALKKMNAQVPARAARPALPPGPAVGASPEMPTPITPGPAPVAPTK